MTARESTLSNQLEYLESPEFRSTNTLNLRPIDPEMFAGLQPHADTVTQIYLNHPAESCKLRLEQISRRDGTISHRAIMENIPETPEDTHALQIIETDLTQEAFAFYADQRHYPKLQKARYQLAPGVAVDWLEPDNVLLRIDVTAHIPNILDLSSDLYECVDSPLFDDEFRAQRGVEIPVLQPELRATAIAAEIAHHQTTGNPHTFVTIGGRSGSGKSTIRHAIQTELASLLPGVSIAVLSTDDYHRGLTRLMQYNREVNGSQEPWEDWDARLVYDVDLARTEIEQLINGEFGSSIKRRAYDFARQEPAAISEYIEPAQVVILDGLYAGDAVFDDIAHFRYEVPTGVSTSIWRRLNRDFTAGRAVGDNVNSPEKILRYMLERAEPAYQAQCQ